MRGNLCCAYARADQNPIHPPFPLSLSLVIDLEHAMPEPGDDADAPIIVPRPGQILRRTARTKIRKAGQTSEGAHRFNATRRGAGSKRDAPPPAPDPRSSSDFSTSDNSDAEPSRRVRLLSNESLDDAPRIVRPESYSAEAFIFDAYAHDDVNEDTIKAISPPLTHSLPRRSLSPPLPLAAKEHEPTPPIQAPPQPTPALPPLQHPLPQRASSLVTPQVPVETPSRSPSPVTSVHSDMLSPTRPEFRPVQTQTPAMPPPSVLPGPQGFDARREKEKDKDKRGLFKWGGGEKKGKKDQRDKEKEKDPGFFGSLFGSKKKPEEASPMGLGHGQSGREAAVALLGASKSSRGYVPSPSPQPQVNNYSRYPIHVERAIYRLSHIKLANPRRALYEQVLISNLMFWYLGVINKTQQPQQSQQQMQQKASTEQALAVTGGSGPDPQKEGEEKEYAQVEQAESERGEAKLAMQPQGQQQGQSPALVQQSPQGRRGSLTKTTPTTANTRRAEQPVRGPQYDMQHRAMEQEYGVAFAGARQITTPPASGAGLGYAVQSGTAPAPGPMQMQMSMSMSMSAPVPAPPASSPHNAANLHSAAPGAVAGTSPGRAGATPRRSRSPPLPLGSPTRYVPATTPAGSSPTTTSVSSMPVSTPNPGLVPAQVPVSAEARLPSRSLSAGVVPPMGPRTPGRKAQSAHAVLPLGARRPRTAESAVGGGGEEEDVPLALWQQHQQQQHQQHQHTLLNQQPRRR